MSSEFDDLDLDDDDWLDSKQDEDTASDTPIESADEEPAPERLFPSVVEFVEDFLVHVVCQKMSTTPGSGLRWDPNWHTYPMVVYRLIALHEAFEVARAAGGAEMSNWWIHHFDPHMRMILDGETGPFHRYDANAVASTPAPLKTTPAWNSPLIVPPAE